ncbi:BTAD domain-containing putative transcriptional regulator [Kribbella antiqua]|uniref:BTAD domain-containing putative transcriptional regulator n=1 Tax=Kribbella antiqua TaxID=2512217 RepID=UPI00104E33E8|nr:BTAD domain-containing putative transcriptional regulator [Kribbella antiqua]
MGDIRFTVLGRVALFVDGIEIPVRGRRERAVLAMLLAARRRVLSVDRISDGLWRGDPPETATGSLQVAVSRLRALIEPDRTPRASPRLLVSSGPGYALVVPPETVDAERFAALVDEIHGALAAGEPEQAWRLCEQADGLWAGTPYADIVDAELVRAEVARLEDLRACSLELKAEVQLALGRHALVTGELEALVSTHPFRERIWELYALALYRSGRQGDALAALRRAREVLVESLGIDPSPALQQLEAQVLAQSPQLAVRPAARVPTDRGAVTSSLVPVPADLGTDQRRTTELIGRDDVVTVLQAAIHRVRASRHGETLLVSGEAGIGKTRVVTEFAESSVAAHGARVLWGRCHEADVSPAYWPWVPVVRALAGSNPPPEVAELLAPGAAGHGSSDARSAALRTYDAVSRLLASAARETPLVVVLEDIHWADVSSLQLLAFAAEALQSAPVMLIASLRSGDSLSTPLQACLASLGRLSAVRIPLHGLGVDHVRDLVGCITDGSVDEELAAVVARRTDGNPFFVMELVRLLSAERRLDVAGARQVAVPHGVQDVLRLRLARLGDDVRRLLTIAAITGREFDLDLLADVSGADVEDVLDLLEEAVAAHAVEDGDMPGRYRFTHALVRETLYGSVSLTRRGRLHAATAVALESRLADDPDLVAEVAHHFALGAALRPELAERAVRHAIAAARLAEGRGALDEALAHWEQALSADALAPADDARRRYDVLLGLGRASYRRGDIRGSRAALDNAVEVARVLGDMSLVAEAATSFRGAGVWHWREFGTSDPAMVAVLEDCLTTLRSGPLNARVLASLAMELTYEWRSEEADAIGQRAVEAARAVGDPDLLADVVLLRTMALWGRPGAAEERIALAEEVLTLPLSHEQELYTRFGAAAAHLQRGDTVQAERQVTRCTELARRLRHTGADVPIAWWRYHRALSAGDEAARRLGEEALERHRRSSVVAITDMVPMAELRLGGPGTPVDDSQLETARTHANPAYRAFIAHALAESGRAEEGVAILGPPVPEGAWDYASVVGDCLRVDTLATAGRTDDLPAALARIEPWGHEFAIYGSTDCIGSIAYFIGRGHEALGHLQAARVAYSQAVDRNRAAGIKPWLRRAEQRLASLNTPLSDPS